MPKKYILWPQSYLHRDYFKAKVQPSWAHGPFGNRESSDFLRAGQVLLPIGSIIVCFCGLYAGSLR